MGFLMELSNQRKRIKKKKKKKKNGEKVQNFYSIVEHISWTNVL